MWDKFLQDGRNVTGFTVTHIWDMLYVRYRHSSLECNRFIMLSKSSDKASSIVPLMQPQLDPPDPLWM
jgi:hypothetical protein